MLVWELSFLKMNFWIEVQVDWISHEAQDLKQPLLLSFAITAKLVNLKFWLQDPREEICEPRGELYEFVKLRWGVREY